MGVAAAHDGWRFVTLIDDDGNPPCIAPDDCDVCRLFDRQRPDEARAEWLARITGLGPIAHQEVS